MGHSFQNQTITTESGNSSAVRSPGFSNKWILVSGAIWLSLIVAGMALVLVHSNTAGAVGIVPNHWPADSQISFDGRLPQLVMFAHPQCPCTRASIGELNQLMSDCQGRLAAQVWVIKPAGVEASWTNSDLFQAASQIPGVTVHWDEGDVEARRFHAETSGQTLLYDRNGNLLFQGGLTIARGHYGDSPALISLESVLKQKSPVVATGNAVISSPVFGCSLNDDQCRQSLGGGMWK